MHRLLFAFVILHSSFVMAQTSGQWEMRKRNANGTYTSYGTTLTDGQAIRIASGIPSAFTPLVSGDLTPYLLSATAASTYEPIITAGTTGQYYRGDKTWQTLNASAVGLGSVSNALQLVAANNLSDLTNAATARSNIGLVIGTNVQAYDAELSAFASLSNASGVLTNNGTGTLSYTGKSAGGNYSADSGKLATFAADGSLKVSTSFQVNASGGDDTQNAQLLGAGIYFNNVSGSGFHHFLNAAGVTPTANRVHALPDASGTLIGTGNLNSITAVGTLTSGEVPTSLLTGTVSNAQLANSSITINGSPVSLGGSTTISTGLSIGSTATSGAASGDILTSNGTALQKLTPGAGVSTWLATPSSSNLAAAVTGETGTGSLVFGVNPVFGGSSGDYISLASSGTRELRLSSNAFALGTANWLVGMYDSGSLVAPAGSSIYWETQVAIRGDVLLYEDIKWNDGWRLARQGFASYHAMFREGTNANRFSVANTYTSTTNHEAFTIDWQTTANTVRVGTVKGSGGGTARDMIIQTDGTERIRISATGEIFMTLPTSAGTTGSLWNDSGTVKVAP